MAFTLVDSNLAIYGVMFFVEDDFSASLCFAEICKKKLQDSICISVDLNLECFSRILNSTKLADLLPVTLQKTRIHKWQDLYNFN